MDHDRYSSRLLRMGILGLMFLGLVSHLAWAAEPEIAVREIAGNRYNLMVMEADGSNPTRLIVKRPNSGRHAYLPSWSPGGDWIAFRDRDADGADAIFKISSNGGEPTLVLCGSGTGDGFTYDSLDYVRWSPNGQWLLVRASKSSGEYWLAVVAATEVEDGDCTSDLAILYYVGWDGLEGEGWWSWNGPTWNGDGSKIAIFEFYERDGLVVGWRLQILHVDYASGKPEVVDENPILLADPDYPIDLSLANVNLEFSGSHPDWQRQSGSLLTFTLSKSLTMWLCWIDTDTGAWGYLLVGSNASWSPDNHQVVFSQYPTSSGNPDLVLADVGYDANVPSISTRRTIGDGQFADWKRGPLSTCSSDAECSEGQLCDTDSGVCFEPECGALDLPPCEDFNDCTDDLCVAYKCVFPSVTAGSACDDGDFCTENDACDGSGVCEGVFNPDISGCEPPSCGAVGDSCSSGADCCSGLCHPKKGVCK